MSKGAGESFQQRMQRLEGLLGQIERFADPEAREIAREVVQTLLELHGAGLAALIERTREAGPAGEAFLDTFARDELISTLLLLYDLHPVEMATRVARALEELRPALRAQGGDVELLSVAEAVVRVRVTENQERTLRKGVEDSILAAAPDAVRIDVEAIVPGPSRSVPLPMLGQRGKLP